MWIFTIRPAKGGIHHRSIRGNCAGWLKLAASHPTRWYVRALNCGRWVRARERRGLFRRSTPAPSLDAAPPGSAVPKSGPPSRGDSGVSPICHSLDAVNSTATGACGEGAELEFQEWGKEFGPYDFEGLRDAAEKRLMDVNTLVRQEPDGEWISALTTGLIPTSLLRRNTPGSPWSAKNLLLVSLGCFSDCFCKSRDGP